LRSAIFGLTVRSQAFRKIQSSKPTSQYEFEYREGETKKPRAKRQMTQSVVLAIPMGRAQRRQARARRERRLGRLVPTMALMLVNMRQRGALCLAFR